MVKEGWQQYKEYGKVWRVALGKPAIKYTQIHDNGKCWKIWFNVGIIGIWWRS